MSKENNLTDFLTDVADAIREKKGTTDKINPQDFSDEIKGIKTSMWTGHADVEGLKAIGWDDEDIAYFQEHGVNWNEEDDEYYKVSDDNKALYGVLTADNIQEYKDRIVYLPKIDLKNNNLSSIFLECTYMKAVPHLYHPTSDGIPNMFRGCVSLICIPPMNFNNLRSINGAFYNCYSLRSIPDFILNNPYSAGSTFTNCTSIDKITASNYDRLEYFAINCRSLTELNIVGNISKSSVTDMVTGCFSLIHLNLSGLAKSLNMKDSPRISKESIVNLIKNELSTSSITITLHEAAYARLATDADIVEALTNHPNVTLASA